MKSKSVFLVCLSCALLTSHCAAAVAIRDFSIEDDSVSFNVSGTMPEEVPPSLQYLLLVANPDVLAQPGFTVGLGPSSNESSSGAQSLRSLFPVATGSNEFGDYFLIAFEDDLSAGQELAGSFSATWSTPVVRV